MKPRDSLVLLGPLLALTVLHARPASSWGTPHNPITFWGLMNVPPEDRLDQRLGRRRMEDLAWNADYQNDVMPDHYIDDYLLFPSYPKFSSHVMPDVAQTWKPFFRRTLQALRTESSTNAARWLGSFLHFVEDSGSPPHALPTGGILHTRMENYVLALDIRLNDYKPRLLGTTDDEAADGVEKRMRELVAYSRERAEKMLPAAQRDDRAACEPLVRECAIECARVVADVTHTALVLTDKTPMGLATLEGEVTASASSSVSHLLQTPARILIQGTEYSTVTESSPALPGQREYRGRFVLAVPAGKHKVWIYRTGCLPEMRTVRLATGERKTLALRLKDDRLGPNLVRNPDLRIRWLRADKPDHWTLTPKGWRSDTMRLDPHADYHFGARDQNGSRAAVILSGSEPRLANAREIPVRKDGTANVVDPYARLLVKGEAEPKLAWVRRRFGVWDLLKDGEVGGPVVGM